MQEEIVEVVIEFIFLFNSNISNLNTNDIKEGSNNKYYPLSCNNINLNLNTDQIKQGKSNLYVSDFILNKFLTSNLYNITTDNELFRWIDKNPTKYLVYFSSSAAYPIKLQTHSSHQSPHLGRVSDGLSNRSGQDRAG